MENQGFGVNQKAIGSSVPKNCCYARAVTIQNFLISSLKFWDNFKAVYYVKSLNNFLVHSVLHLIPNPIAILFKKLIFGFYVRLLKHLKMTVWISVLWKINIQLAEKWSEMVIKRALLSFVLIQSISVETFKEFRQNICRLLSKQSQLGCRRFDLTGLSSRQVSKYNFMGKQ